MTARVLLVTNDFPPRVGGIQVVQEKLFGALDPDNLWVIASDHPDAPQYDAGLEFSVERVPQYMMHPVPLLRSRLGDTIRRIRPDVVVMGSALPVSLLGGVARNAGIPFVTMVYGAEISVPASIPGPAQLLRRIFDNAAGVVAMGPWVAGWVRRTASVQPSILEIYPGVDTSVFTPGDREAACAVLGLDAGRPTVTSVSRLVPRKGMHLLIEAAARLRHDIPDLQVAIGGTGRETERLGKQISELELGSTLRLLGRVPQEHLPDLYRAADVFTMLCHNRWFGLEQEGFGIVFVEASACATPVVAGRSGGATDAVEDGVTGTVVDATDADEVGAALARYLDDRTLRARDGEAGREKAESTFGWSRQTAAFVDWISSEFG